MNASSKRSETHMKFPMCQGTPILQDIHDDCHYVFHWPTNVICPTHEGEFREKTCEIYNDQLDKSLDLRRIFDDGTLTVCTYINIFGVS